MPGRGINIPVYIDLQASRSSHASQYNARRCSVQDVWSGATHIWTMSSSTCWGSEVNFTRVRGREKGGGAAAAFRPVVGTVEVRMYGGGAVSHLGGFSSSSTIIYARYPKDIRRV